MDRFTLYESFGAVEDALLARCEEERTKPPHWRRWSALAACLCLAVAAAFALPGLLQTTQMTGPLAGPSTAGDHSQGSSTGLESGSNVGEVLSTPEDRDKLAAPGAVEKRLTLAQARALEPFGDYLPAAPSEGFREESLCWYQEGNSSYLSALWTREGAFDELSWRVLPYSEEAAGRVTSTAETQNYDLSLYPLPLADSVPAELWEIVDHPIFRAEELTQEVVDRRAYALPDGNDTTTISMHFGVLYGEVLVEVSAKGISPQWLYEQLAGLQAG